MTRETKAIILCVLLKRLIILLHLSTQEILNYRVTPNHWLVTQGKNTRLHALERNAAAIRQLSNGTNGDDLYILIAAVVITIQTVISPL